MNRAIFIKSLVALAGVAAVPKQWLKTYDKYYLLQCFVRGFKFYEGTAVLPQLKEGDMLELVREPDNEYDECAIALHWNTHKIGFIPREHNEMLSKLLDVGFPELMAEVTHVKAEAAPWENVHIAVFMLKEQAGNPGNVPEYLTTLETPRYCTLKHKGGNAVTRINYYDEDEKGEDYFRVLEEHSRDDSIYDHIMNNLGSTTEYGIGDRVFAVKKKHMAGLKAHVEDAERWMRQADVAFDDTEGLVVLAVGEAEEMIPKISGLADKVDRMGRHFVELVM